MNTHHFIRLRQNDWERLQTLLNQHRGRRPLTAAEVRELGVLYRAVTSDLAQARRDYPGERVTTYLNHLLTQAHSYLYQSDVSNYRQALRYFTRVIPQTYRRTGLFTLTACLLFFIPALIGYIYAYTDPNLAEPLGLQEVRETLENESIWTNIPVEDRPYASAFIMTNNIRVAILAFGGGVALGLFAVYLLAMNGLHVGAVLGLASHYGFGDTLLDFMIGHGVIELSVIFMAGGAGLQMGWALMNPGPYSRRDALGLAAQRAVSLIVISIPLLVIAGLIEGFISPSDTPSTVKVLVGLGSGALMYAYLLLAGRGGVRFVSVQSRVMDVVNR